MILYKTKESEIVRVDGGANGQSLKKYSTTITGDGTKTVFTLEHNLNTEDILFEMSDGTEPALIDYTIVDKNKINTTFAVAPTADEQYNIKIYGIFESDKNNSGGSSGSDNDSNDNKPLLLDAITDLAVSNVTNGSVTLSYTIPENAENIKIYCNLSNDVSTTNYKFTITTTLNTCTFNNLSSNTMYYFVAYATNRTVLSDKSNIVHQKTNIAVPDAINDLKATAESGAVTLSYTIPSGATGVKIYYGTNSNVSSASYQSYTTSTQPSCKIDGLTNSTVYYFVAYAYNNGGNSNSSNITNATPKSKRLYLYNNGDECTNITGGWVPWEAHYPLNKTNNCMEINVNANSKQSIVKTSIDIPPSKIPNDYINVFVEYSCETSCEDQVFQAEFVLNYGNEPLLDEIHFNNTSHKIVSTDYNPGDTYALRYKLDHANFNTLYINVKCFDGYYLNLKIHAIYFE